MCGYLWASNLGGAIGMEANGELTYFKDLIAVLVEKGLGFRLED